MVDASQNCESFRLSPTTEFMMARPATAFNDDYDVQDLIAIALDDTGGIVSDAVDRLFELIIEDTAFLENEMPKMVRAWCANRVSVAVAGKRASAWHQDHDANNARASKRLKAARRVTLLNFPLPKGLRLGDASSSEVLEGAEHYQGKADDAGSKARWLKRIAKEMGNAHRVDDVLDDADLERFKAEEE